MNESFKVLRVFHDRALFVYNGSNIDEYVILLNKKGIKADKRFTAMHKEPFFKSDYFKKLTGSNGINDVDLPGVEKAKFLPWYILTKEAHMRIKCGLVSKITPNLKRSLWMVMVFEWSTKGIR